MIELSGLKDNKYFINTKLIERIEYYSDTVIHLTDSKYYVVRESKDEILKRIHEDSKRIGFIEVNKFNGSKVLINVKLIEKVDFLHETKITLFNNNFFNIKEDKNEMLKIFEGFTTHLNMIDVTGIHKNNFILNDNMIEKIEFGHDTKVILINKKFYFIENTEQDIITKIQQGNPTILDWISIDNKGYII